MFNTMTVTKAGGALCGALLIFLLMNWGANAIYGLGEGGHNEHANAAYVIDVPEAPASASGAAAAVTPVADILAGGDAGKGKKVFSKCKACHKIAKGKNAVGPSLYGVVGRDIGTEAGFTYSSTLTGLDGNWTPEKLFQFLAGPKAYAPGTKMGFAGLKKEKDRANVIAYLQSVVPGSATAAPAKKAEAPAAPTPTPTPTTTEAPAKTAAAAPTGAGDAAAGKKVYKRCKVCHKTVAGKNGIGPSMYGIFGRPVATEAGYKFSNALKGVGGDWTEARLDKWLTKPKAFAPGTKMGFAGLKKAKDRTNLIAYLKTLAN